MRCYVNDVSLQGQYSDAGTFIEVLRDVLALRSRNRAVRGALFVDRQLSTRLVTPSLTLREALRKGADRDLIALTLNWLDRNGPFLEDERTPENEDYFECLDLDVTNSGLGEAARRLKGSMDACSFSFPGGSRNFCASPLTVDHGLPGARYGAFEVHNTWTAAALPELLVEPEAEISTWQELWRLACDRYPTLKVPNSAFQHSRIASEPFSAVIANSAMRLLGYLHEYMLDRSAEGAEGAVGRKIIKDYFVGANATFSGESPTNQRDFERLLTFRDEESLPRVVFAHWHGKIRHRFFRLHFEWPVPRGAERLFIAYLGPKLTVS